MQASGNPKAPRSPGRDCQEPEEQGQGLPRDLSKHLRPQPPRKRFGFLHMGPTWAAWGTGFRVFRAFMATRATNLGIQM